MGNSSEHSDPSLLRRHSEPETAPNQARQRGFPANGRVSFDPGTRFLAGVNGSTVLLGGSPLRLLTLTGKSAAVVAALAEGASASEAASAAATSVKSTNGLMDRLLDAQLVHPLWPSTSITEIEENPLSTVTLVIPVKDREVQLRRLLMSVQREMSEGLSVVVVDDGSTDDSGNVAREFGATVLRHEQSLGPAGARNRGLEAVTTPFVAFVDSDCTCTYGWLSLLLQHFADPSVALVAPRIFGEVSLHATPEPVRRGTGHFESSSVAPVNISDVDPIHPAVAKSSTAVGPAGSSALDAYESVRSPLDLGPEQALIVPRTRVSYVTSAALLARTDVLRALSGFSTELHVGEDVDLLWRLHAAGWRSRYEPRATVAHDHRVAWRAFAKRRYQYGSSAALLDARHPGQVAPLAVSGWSALGWLGLCTLSPVGVVGGLGIMAVTTALLPRKLSAVANPRRLALDLAGRGHLGAGRQLASATWRAYLPLAVLSALLPKPLGAIGRRILIASALIPNVAEWRSKRPKLDPIRYVGIRLLDDGAYCAGVWSGALKLRSFRALKPDFSSWPGKGQATKSTSPPAP